jgi:hypothetical protein
MKAAVVSVIAVMTMFAAMAIPVAVGFVKPSDVTSQASDERLSHLPAIEVIRGQTISVDAPVFPLAMPPTYHYAMAGVARLSGGGLTAMRLANVAISLALVAVIVGTAVQLAGVWGVALSLPAVASPHVLSSAIWLSTDNTGWLLTLLMISSCMQPSARSGKAWTLRAIAATMAVLVRQVHIWVVTPMIARAIADRKSSPSTSFRVGAWIACALPILAVSGLALAWGGLVPPAFGLRHISGLTPSVPLIALAVAGVAGPFLIASWWHLSREMGAFLPWILLATALVFIAIPSSYDPAAGRWGGVLWELIRRTPAVANRSVILLPLALSGAASLYVLYQHGVRVGRSTEAQILIASLAAAVLSQVANAAFQRYVEPIVLVAMIWLTALSWSDRFATAHRSLALWSVGALTILVLAVDVATIYRPLWQ